VVANPCRFAPCSTSATPSIAPFETTCQLAGAVTVIVIVALRSGWSKQANIRLASAVSNWL
jgi:hypothetical protein